MDGSHKKHKETKVKSTKTVKEAYVFLGLTLAFSYFVFWGPLALFKIPTISFVSDVKRSRLGDRIISRRRICTLPIGDFSDLEKGRGAWITIIRPANHSIQAWLALVHVYLPDRYCWNGRATNY